MKKYIMALDAGTTSNRCILFDHDGKICSVAQKEFTQYFPKPGWVEHDANEIWTTQLGVALSAMNKIGATAEDIAAIGIANQRETTIVWDRDTGEPIYHAIVWQCRRTSEYCDKLKAEGYTEMIREKTGLIIDAYFSATKLKWILDNVAGCAGKGRGRAAAVRHRGDLADLEADLRQGACDRLLQRQPDDAVQHPHAGLGRRHPEAAGHPPQRAAQARFQQRILRVCRPDALLRRHRNRRCSRRPAGRAVRPDLL